MLSCAQPAHGAEPRGRAAQRAGRVLRQVVGAHLPLHGAGAGAAADRQGGRHAPARALPAERRPGPLTRAHRAALRLCRRGQASVQHGAACWRSPRGTRAAARARRAAPRTRHSATERASRGPRHMRPARRRPRCSALCQHVERSYKIRACLLLSARGRTSRAALPRRQQHTQLSPQLALESCSNVGPGRCWPTLATLRSQLLPACLPLGCPALLNHLAAHAPRPFVCWGKKF